MSERVLVRGKLHECEKLCMTKIRLEQEQMKNFFLAKNLEKFKQDASSLLRQLSLVFAISLYLDRIRDFPSVNSVYVIEREDIIDIWTFIEEGDLDLEEKIAEAQCELMRIHRELDFDFMVVPRFGRETSQLLPPNSKQIYPENELR